MFQVLGCLHGLNIGTMEDFPGKGHTLGAGGLRSVCADVQVHTLVRTKCT